MLTMFMSSSLVFQSTLSMRRATHIDGYAGSLDLFQSTLSMRRATALSTAFTTAPMVISIHALHEESDEGELTWIFEHGYFNPRSP